MSKKRPSYIERLVVAYGWKEGLEKDQLSTGYFWSDEDTLELVVIAAQPCEYTKKPQNRMLSNGEFYDMQIIAQF